MRKINIKFIIAFIISAFMYIIIGTSVSNGFFYMMSIIFILSILSIIFNYAFIDIAAKFNNRLYYVGNSINIKIIARNKSLFSINYLTIENKILNSFGNKYDSEAINVGSFSKKEMNYNFVLRRRGIYNINNYNLEMSDLFSILRIKKNLINGTDIVKVYPTFVDINLYNLFGNEKFEDVDKSIGVKEDMHSIKDIRKYLPGDNIKKINWKVSAKNTELMVKNYDNIGGNEINVFLDMNRYNYDIDPQKQGEEKLISVAASLIRLMNKKSVDVALWCNNKNSDSVRFSDEIDENILEFFVDRKSDGNLNFSEFIKGQIDNITKGSIITIIVGKVTEEINMLAEYLTSINYEPVILYLKSVNEDNGKQFICIDDIIEGGK